MPAATYHTCSLDLRPVDVFEGASNACQQQVKHASSNQICSLDLRPVDVFEVNGFQVCEVHEVRYLADVSYFVLLIFAIYVSIRQHTSADAPRRRFSYSVLQIFAFGW
jgi:hypothetical protein